MIKDLVEYIAKSLADAPDEVRVRQIEGETSIVVELHVAPEDMGKVIGKEGRVAKAMRTLLKIAAANQGKRAILEID
jgi:predicted RNA-binding protein YlqC (UPF0109 family)